MSFRLLAWCHNIHADAIFSNNCQLILGQGMTIKVKKCNISISCVVVLLPTYVVLVIIFFISDYYCPPCIFTTDQAI